MMREVTILQQDLRGDCAFSWDSASKKDQARLESSCARSLTAAALSLYLKSTPSFEDLRGEVRTPEGKPYFPAFPAFHYSISHSAGLVVCAAWEAPIGIDLQQIPSDPQNAMRIANHFFSEGEQNALRQLQTEDPNAMLLLFSRLWTARESYVKLIGRGLAEPFDNYCPDLTEGRIHTKSGESFSLTACRAPTGYCMTLCSHEPIPPEEIHYISYPISNCNS